MALLSPGDCALAGGLDAAPAPAPAADGDAEERRLAAPRPRDARAGHADDRRVRRSDADARPLREVAARHSHALCLEGEARGHRAAAVARRRRITGAGEHALELRPR